MLVAISLFVLLATIILYNHFHNIQKHKWLSQFPGASLTLPIVGNSLQFYGHPSRFAGIFQANFAKYGTTWRLWIMEKPTLVTSDPNLVKELLSSNSHLKKHFIYDDAGNVIIGKYGLITSEVEQWKTDRKLFNPIFNFKQFEESFQQCVEGWPKLKAQISNHGTVEVDTLLIFKQFFLSIILTSFSASPLMSDEKIMEILNISERCYEVVRMRMMKPWTRNSLYWKLSGYQNHMDKFHQCMRPIVDNLEAHYSTEKKHDDTEFNSDSREIKDTKAVNTLRDIFTNMGKPYQWKCDHSITIAGAGMDTSAITLTMTLFFLALTPECQAKAQEEVDHVFKDRKDSDLSFSDLPKLKYLSCCVKEALRIHSSAPLIGRTTTEDILLDDGRKIPAGSSILIIIQEIHKNPSIFPNPSKFDPERFNEANLSSIKPYTYLPFSKGPRNCIGQKYADSVLLPALALLLRNFSIKTLQTQDDITILYEVAGTAYPSVKLIFEQRKH